MNSREIDRLLVELGKARRNPPDSAVLIEILARLGSADIPDLERVAQFHDALLFLCAYPTSPSVRRSAETILKRFAGRTRALARSDDFNPLLDPEISGIAGTEVKVAFSYELARWLVLNYPNQVSIDWNEEPDPERLAAVLPLLVPLLEEEASVDANVPYGKWLRSAGARPSDGGLAWLIERLERLPLLPRRRAILYDSLGLWIHWRLLNSAATRTNMRRPPRTIYYQQSAPLGRREVSIERELAGPALPLTRLSRLDGETVLDMARAALATRYREFYCFNHGDPATVVAADCGRGLEVLLIGIVPEKRPPLRAGFAHLILRNGVPIGYGDAFGLCERLEVSFNIFYAFRDGESAFCLARLLALYHQFLGSTSFSIDPYQIGFENDEAIESGAFWFYRKLGFRCTDPDIERLARREEDRTTKEPGHRTSPRILKQMAQGSLVWESPAFDAPTQPKHEWDRFHIRNLGLAVQKRFARAGQTSDELQESTLGSVMASLRIDIRSFTKAQRLALARIAPVLALIPDLKKWPPEELNGVIDIVRAKAGRSERPYLQLLARHQRLRSALIRRGT